MVIDAFLQEDPSTWNPGACIQYLQYVGQTARGVQTTRHTPLETSFIICNSIAASASTSTFRYASTSTLTFQKNHPLVRVGDTCQKSCVCFRFVFYLKLRADGGLDLSGYEYDDDDGDLSVNDGDAVVSYPI